MTADLTDRIGRAALQVEVPWTPERAALVLRGVHGRRRQQRRLRGLGAAVGVLALLVLGPRLVASLRGRGAAATTQVASVQPAVAPQVSGELSLAERPVMRLRDGSLVRPRGRASQVRVREDRPGRTVVALTGAAQFEVVHDPLRLFRVETRGLAVEVLGTQFVVEEHGAGIRVAVQQGRVRVLWASHYDEVGAGHSAIFSPEQPAAQPTDADPESGPIASAPPPLMEPAPLSARTPLTEPTPLSARTPLAEPTPLSARTPLTEPTPLSAPATAPSPASSGLAHLPPAVHPGGRRAAPRPPHALPPSPTAEPPAAEAAPATPSPTEPESWQALAREGQFEQAYSLAYGPPATASGTHRAPPLLREREVGPGELLLLADVARLSRHPADAVAPLSRLLREQPADPRAPLAAFTLGRVLLDELGRPREAAQSFLRVQELDPDGPLSQDALAREVEAWSRAGEGASARTRALHYLQKYPSGRRLRSVRHFGELL